MLRSYFRTALRNLRRQGRYTLTNVVGLAIGLAVFGWIGLYVLGEMQYDTFHSKSDRIVRLVSRVDMGTRTSASPRTSSNTGPLLASTLPDVDSFVRFRDRGAVAVRRADDGSRPSYENGFLYADSTLWDVFSFELVRGVPETALVAPFSVVLTESTATTYFGDDDPLGRRLVVGTGQNAQTYTVTGVAADPPFDSSIQFRFLASFSSLRQIERGMIGAWNTSAYPTYLLGSSASAETTSSARLERLRDRIGGVVHAETNAEMVNRTTFDVEPLTDVHFSDIAGLTPPGNRSLVFILGSIAFLILFVAGANYVNLATAQATQRAREIGVRKSLGAARSSIASQLIGESLLYSFVALGLAGLLSAAALPLLSSWLSIPIPFERLLTPFNVSIVVGTVVLVGMAAGLYPAWVFSSFSPSDVLRGTQTQARSGLTFRRVSALFQVVVCAGLLFGAFVIEKQLRHIQSKPLGIATENVMAVEVPYGALDSSQFDVFRNQTRRLPGIASASVASGIPTGRSASTTVTAPGVATELDATLLSADPSLLETLQLRLRQGRMFRPSESSRSVLINETARQMLGWNAPVGSTITLGGRPARIIGVVNDFHLASMREEIRPLVLTPRAADFDTHVIFRLKGDDVQHAVSQVEATWRDVAGDLPFSYLFLDDAFERLHRTDQQLSRLFRIVVILALFVSGIGLYGLLTFTTGLHRKEIGIRKTFGATRRSLVYRLGIQYVWLAAAAVTLALPVASVAAQSWLSEFAYHTDVGIATFALSTALIVAFVGVLVLAQVLRASSISPIHLLRSD